MENPYQPPATDFATPGHRKLYSPRHVAWASFLGAPLAGCVLLAINYRRFGNPAGSHLALVSGFVATAALLAITFVLPDNFPNTVLPAAYTWAMFQCAKSLQGGDYERVLAQGGTKASAWAATGIGLLSLVCITVALVAIFLVAPAEWHGEEV